MGMKAFDFGTATVVEPVRTTAPGRWVVTIPGYQPVPLNDIIGQKPLVIHGIKDKDRRKIGDELRLAGVSEAAGKRRVSLRIDLAKRQRACDPDAYWKVLLDSLVAGGFLKNDSRQWVELGAVEFERGKQKATVIEIEDIRGR